jgi:hypothetical protein
MRSAPRAADKWAPPCRNDHAYTRAMITAQEPRGRDTSSHHLPTSPMTPTWHHLKRRSHSARLAATIAAH